jgi:hypothetical protein
MRREAIALWAEVFDEPAPAGMGTSDMLAVIVRHLEVKDYARLYAADRARGLTWPRYDAVAASSKFSGS